MKEETFPSSWYDFQFMVGGLLVAVIASYLDHGLPTRNLLYWLICIIALMLLNGWRAQATTYLKIINGRTLVNSGYRSFGRDSVDIRDIKYVCRTKTFIWKSWGSTMVIYLLGDDGKIRYTALKEVNWKDEELKRFLRRLLEIKPTIDLDQEYKDLLAGKFDKTGGLRANASDGTPESMDKYLKGKGEKYDESSVLSRFFEKFR